jgi:endo-1,4-beta-xylanase
VRVSLRLYSVEYTTRDCAISRWLRAAVIASWVMLGLASAAGCGASSKNADNLLGMDGAALASGNGEGGAAAGFGDLSGTGGGTELSGTGGLGGGMELSGTDGFDANMNSNGNIGISGSGETGGNVGPSETGGSGGSSGPTPTYDGNKFVGNITTRGQVDTGGRTFSTYWNQITPENEGKWGSVQSSGSSGFNWAALDAIYDYTQKNGIIFKEHTFLWGAQQPGGGAGLTEDNVKNWMQQFCARYPKTALIDVVNEPPPHTTPAYANSIGGGTNTTWQWIANAFIWARDACPGAILILNDYNIIEWPNDNKHYIDIVKAIQALGAPIDAIGSQSHGLSGANPTTDTMKTLITKLHNDTGLPVYITEYDISQSDDQAQLTKYQEHIPFFLSTEWIHGITVWGWIYGSTWRQAPLSGLIRDGAPRPAMTWLMEQLGRPAP